MSVLEKRKEREAVLVLEFAELMSSFWFAVRNKKTHSMTLSPTLLECISKL